MKFGRLQLTNFTVFEDATFDFCPGLNVLIGANGTGKSHVLKAAYAIQKTWDESVHEHATDDDQICSHFVNHIWLAISNVFGVELSELIRYEPALDLPSNVQVLGEAEIKADAGILCLSNNRGSDGSRLIFTRLAKETSKCLFIPTREILASFEDFAPVHSPRELNFDRTFFDLFQALSKPNLTGDDAKWGRQIAENLEKELGGTVELRKDRFYVDERPAFIVAEGHRKLAMLVQLLKNGAINANTTIYWDEPESGLNPKLVKVIADTLMLLAENGVQIVFATHDYLLTQEISHAVEYQIIKTPVRFFSLTADHPASPVTVQIGDMLADLDRNPIQEEFTALYDREQSLFYSTKPATAAKGES